MTDYNWEVVKSELKEIKSVYISTDYRTSNKPTHEYTYTDWLLAAWQRTQMNIARLDMMRVSGIRPLSRLSQPTYTPKQRAADMKYCLNEALKKLPDNDFYSRLRIKINTTIQYTIKCMSWTDPATYAIAAAACPLETLNTLSQMRMLL
jgi:hypothetical protein